MNTKLTLSIDDEVIKKAKKYAHDQGRSISGLIENYLRFLTQEKQSKRQSKASLIKGLKGSFNLPEGSDYKSILQDQLNDKYGR